MSGDLLFLILYRR